MPSQEDKEFFIKASSLIWLALRPIFWITTNASVSHSFSYLNNATEMSHLKV